MTATAEFVVPRSMPITCPFTFSSPPVDCHLANDEPRGVRRLEDREMADVARGRAFEKREDNIVKASTEHLGVVEGLGKV